MAPKGGGKAKAVKFAPDAGGGKEDGGDRPSGRGASEADAIDVDEKNTGRPTARSSTTSWRMGS